MVYNTGYGGSIGLYDSTINEWLSDCFVDSSASSSRRAGIAVEFAATASKQHATAAAAAAQTVTPAAMATSVAQASAALQSSGVVTMAVAAPTLEQIAAIKVGW